MQRDETIPLMSEIFHPIFHIYQCCTSNQKWMTKYKRDVIVFFHIKNNEVYWKYKLVSLNQVVFNNASRVFDRPISQLEWNYNNFAFPKPNVLKKNKGIKLWLYSKSHNILSICLFPMLEGIVKLFRSFNFNGNLC